MVLAVAALLFQFQATPAVLSSANRAAIVTTAAPAKPAKAASTAPAPSYIVANTDSSTARLNVTSVKFVADDSKVGTLHPVSSVNFENTQSFSTIRIPDASESKRRSFEEAVNVPSRKQWIALGILEHAAAGLDAYSTRQAIGHGAVEDDPLIRPFAHSGAVYAATQVSPILFDLLARHMQHSEYSLIRRVWWMPQSLSAGVSIFSGVHNLNLANKK
jgi:hypothetical protein